MLLLFQASTKNCAQEVLASAPTRKQLSLRTSMSVQRSQTSAKAVPVTTRSEASYAAVLMGTNWTRKCGSVSVSVMGLLGRYFVCSVFVSVHSGSIGTCHYTLGIFVFSCPSGCRLDKKTEPVLVSWCLYKRLCSSLEWIFPESSYHRCLPIFLSLHQLSRNINRF